MDSYKNKFKLAPKGNNSFFITFEGIEGSGKSTQLQLLIENLKQQSFHVFCFREPGGTLFGEKLRSAILNSTKKINPYAEALLFASARAQLLTELVLEKLKNNNTIVILDRYIDSSIAYQGFARELGFEKILDIHQYFPLYFMPDITFYLQIDLETSLKRQESRGAEKDYFEKEKQDFYLKLIEGYNFSASYFNDRIKIINAINTIEDVTKEINQTWNLFITGKN